MKRIISLVCLVCVFGFTAPSANAILKIPAKKKLYEPVNVIETAILKIPAKKKLYEPVNGIETAMIKIPVKKSRLFEPIDTV